MTPPKRRRAEKSRHSSLTFSGATAEAAGAGALLKLKCCCSVRGRLSRFHAYLSTSGGGNMYPLAGYTHITISSVIRHHRGSLGCMDAARGRKEGRKQERKRARKGSGSANGEIELRTEKVVSSTVSCGGSGSDTEKECHPMCLCPLNSPLNAGRAQSRSESGGKWCYR